MGEEPADAARRAAGSLVVLDGLLRLVSAGAGNGLGRVQAADSRSRPPSGYGEYPACLRERAKSYVMHVAPWPASTRRNEKVLAT